MASDDDRIATCKCFSFCTKPKKPRRVELFPPLTEEEMLQPVSPVDEPVHGGSVYESIVKQQQLEGASAAMIPGEKKKPAQVLAPDVQHALKEYEKLAFQQSIGRANRDQASSSNPALPGP